MLAEIVEAKNEETLILYPSRVINFLHTQSPVHFIDFYGIMATTAITHSSPRFVSCRNILN